VCYSDRQHEPDNPRLKRLAVRRAMARLTDAFLLFLPVSWIFLALLPDSIGWMLALLACFLMEGTLITMWGASPGKLVLGLRVVGVAGPITFNTALKRSIQVWVLGEAMGLWMFWNISLAVAYRRYMDRGRAIWDENCETDVIATRPIGDGWLR